MATNNYRYAGAKPVQMGTGNTIPIANTSGVEGESIIVLGTNNTIYVDAGGDLPRNCYVLGRGNDVSGNCSGSVILGEAHDVDCQWVTIGGYSNDLESSADGAWGAVMMGRSNTMQKGGDGTVMMGYSNTLSSGGATSTAHDANSVFGNSIEHYGGGTGGLFAGYFNSLGKSGQTWDIGPGCLAAGYINTLYGWNGTIIGDTNKLGVTGNRNEGRSGLAMGRQVWGKYAGGLTFGGGAHSAVGDSQSTLAVAKIQTTDATATELLFGDGSNTHRAIVANDTTAVFEALIVGRQTDADDNSGAYKIQGAIDNNANTVALVGTPSITTIGEDTAGWAVSAAADDTNKSLKLIVTGAAGDAVNWTGQLNIIEVTG